MPKVNIHPIERVIRGIVGLVVLSLMVGAQERLGSAGPDPACDRGHRLVPAVRSFGISTCPKKTGE